MYREDGDAFLGAEKQAVTVQRHTFIVNYRETLLPRTQGKKNFLAAFSKYGTIIAVLPGAQH